MSIQDELPEELLMAYADGELNAPDKAAERAQVEAAMKTNPDVARRVEEHKALRAKLSGTFDRVLSEPVPDRLLTAVRSTPRKQATVTDLSQARAARADSTASAQDTLGNTRSVWSWPQWGAMAASLIIGAVVGHVALKSPELGPIASRDGHLVAQAGLAEALSTQLASTQSAMAPVQIGTSFKSKSGDYCRTFVVREGDAVGGLACHNGDMWNVRTLARVDATGEATGGFRTAASEMPAAVRTAVEEQIVGDPLDSGGEAQALKQHWK